LLKVFGLGDGGFVWKHSAGRRDDGWIEFYQADRSGPIRPVGSERLDERARRRAVRKLVGAIGDSLRPPGLGG